MSTSGLERLLLIEKVLILKSLGIFKDTPENILAELAPLMHEIEYEKDVLIFSEGQIGDQQGRRMFQQASAGCFAL